MDKRVAKGNILHHLDGADEFYLHVNSDDFSAKATGEHGIRTDWYSPLPFGISLPPDEWEVGLVQCALSNRQRIVDKVRVTEWLDSSLVLESELGHYAFQDPWSVFDAVQQSVGSRMPRENPILLEEEIIVLLRSAEAFGVFQINLNSVSALLNHGVPNIDAAVSQSSSRLSLYDRVYTDADLQLVLDVANQPVTRVYGPGPARRSGNNITFYRYSSLPNGKGRVQSGQAFVTKGMADVVGAYSSLSEVTRNGDGRVFRVMNLANKKYMYWNRPNFRPNEVVYIPGQPQRLLTLHKDPVSRAVIFDSFKRVELICHDGSVLEIPRQITSNDFAEYFGELLNDDVLVQRQVPLLDLFVENLKLEKPPRDSKGQEILGRLFTQLSLPVKNKRLSPTVYHLPDKRDSRYFALKKTDVNGLRFSLRSCRKGIRHPVFLSGSTNLVLHFRKNALDQIHERTLNDRHGR